MKRSSSILRTLGRKRRAGASRRPGATELRRSTPFPVRQRGAAALAVTVALVFVMTLGGLFLHRNLLVEQRASANQYAAAQAFEAAEAGLQWVEAQLNANRRLGADCLPAAGTAAAEADAFHERYLRLEPGSGLLLPRLPAGATALRPGCVTSMAGFVCSCPSGGPAALGRPPGDGPFPAFRVELLAGARPGTVRIVSTGCNTALPPCIDSATGRADATARVEAALGLLGAFRIPPAALLTAGGHVDASAAVFPAAAARAGTAGSAMPSVRADPATAALGRDRFFAASFGLDRPRWAARPVVTRVVCQSDCAAALTAAVAERGLGATLWVDGDLALAGPVVLGSTARPVLVVVDGTARLSGAVELHGTLYAGTIVWDGAGPGIGAAVHGALLAEGDYGGGAAVAFLDDPEVLRTLTRFAGSFARIAGSWRDFQ